MKFLRTIRKTVVVGTTVATVAVLASCGGSDSNDDNNGGGGGGGTNTPPAAANTPPASASESPQGFIAFLKTVVVTQPVADDPLDLTGFVAPLDDTSADPDLTV